MTEATKAIIIRNSFYKRLHYYALVVLIIAVIVIGIMASVLWYISGNYTKPLYFATDNVGRLIKITPVSEPNMSDEDVIAWAIEGVESAFSFDFVNYRNQLQSSQKYFTNYGWSKYMDALKASNNLIALDKRKMVVVATVVDKPTILTKGLLSGAYAWRIQMSVSVDYFYPPYDAPTLRNPVAVTVIVQRGSLLESYKGLGIVQLIGTIATAPTGPAPAPLSTTPT